jgi:hypothetical protein
MYVARFAVSITAVAVLACAMLATLSACATPVGDPRRPTRHFHLVNATFDSVTALAFAPAESASFQGTAFSTPLQGGLTSIMVGVPAGECLRDVRVTFLDGREVVYPNLDVCRYDGLRLMQGGGESGRLVLLRRGL